MSPKKESVPALLRKIERLEAQVQALQASNKNHFARYVELLHEAVDLRERNQQAIELLQGGDV